MAEKAEKRPAAGKKPAAGRIFSGTAPYALYPAIKSRERMRRVLRKNHLLCHGKTGTGGGSVCTKNTVFRRRGKSAGVIPGLSAGRGPGPAGTDADSRTGRSWAEPPPSGGCPAPRGRIPRNTTRGLIISRTVEPRRNGMRAKNSSLKAYGDTKENRSVEPR